LLSKDATNSRSADLMPLANLAHRLPRTIVRNHLRDIRLRERAARVALRLHRNRVANEAA